METKRKLKRENLWAVVVGIGLALSPLHNVWLTELTTQNGEVGFFLPSFGVALWLIGSLAFLTWETKRWRDLDLGDKAIYIPLLVLVGAMVVSGFVGQPAFNDKVDIGFAESLIDKLSPGLWGIGLFGVYLASRSMGAMLFRPLIPFVILGIALAIAGGIINSGVHYPEQPITLISNYCALAGFLIFGGIVNQGRWQWVFLMAILGGLFFVSALEAVFIVGVLALTVLLRRDMEKKAAIMFGAFIPLVVIWGIFGYLVPMYRGGSGNVPVLFGVLSGNIPLNMESLTAMTSGRWPVIVSAIQSITFLGHGYSLSTVGGRVIHNIPLIILYQIGVLGAAAWTFVTVYCLVKTKWKYAWVAIIAMSVFDHYLWTQMVPYWWALIGVSTASNIGNDYIFRREHGSLGHNSNGGMV